MNGPRVLLFGGLLLCTRVPFLFLVRWKEARIGLSMKQLEFTHTTPLHQDADGTIRLKGSRVTLETLVGALKRGDTPEQIQEGFPSLSLAQVSAAIAWYFNNQVDADNYLNQRAVEAETFRHQIESRPEYAAFRLMIRQRREQ